MFIKVGPTIINTDLIARADFTPMISFNCRGAIPATLKLSLVGQTELMHVSGEAAERAWELFCAKSEADEHHVYGLARHIEDMEDDEEIEWDDVIGSDDRVGIAGMTLDSATQAD